MTGAGTDINAVLDKPPYAPKLLIMACSGTKRPDAGPLTALERYDGPMWRTLRAQLRRYPNAVAARASGEFDIWVLSGRYGFVPALIEMPNYEQRLTAEVLAKMARDPSYDFQRIAGMVEDANAVMFAGGEMYRDAMWRAAGGSLWHLMKISETDGGGIGEHRAQLGAWFAEQFGEGEGQAASPIDESAHPTIANAHPIGGIADNREIRR